MFEDVQVYLVYPKGVYRDPENLNKISFEKIEGFWRSYFKNRGNDNINIYSFTQFNNIFNQAAVPSENELALEKERRSIAASKNFFECCIDKFTK